MRINHISVSSTNNNYVPNKLKDGAPYSVFTELDVTPTKQWKESFSYIWYNTPFYNRSKFDVAFKENLLSVTIYDSSDIQYAIDTICKSVLKTENLIRSTGKLNITQQPVITPLHLVNEK